MKLNELLAVAQEELKDFTTVIKPDFRLEEAEYDKDTKIWNVVVSFLVENTNKRLIATGTLLSDFQYHRIYKKLKINDHKALVGLYMYEK